MSKLGCVYCDPTNTNWQPTKFYILDGCSVCEYCLRKIQTQNEDPEPEDKDDLDAGKTTIFAEHSGLTFKLFSSNGTCLMTGPISSPVITGDEVTFPPIKISL